MLEALEGAARAEQGSPGSNLLELAVAASRVRATVGEISLALELLALGKLQGYKGNPEAGVFPAQAFTCDDFVALQKEYGFPGGMLEMDSEYKRARDHSAFVAPVGGVGA